MADLPITFSGPMVRAILREIEQRGTGKTQTRRGLVLRRYRGFSQFGRSDTPGYDWRLRDSRMLWHDLRHAELLKLLPYKTGDRLYVREHWRSWRWNDDLRPSAMPTHWAGKPEKYICYIADEADDRMDGRFRQAMHMPKWGSRITLIVTDVRVQRLQDISEEDAVAEGLSPDPVSGRYFCGMDEVGPITAKSPVTAYAWLWNSLHGEGDWARNPWVAAYTFRPVLGSIDRLPVDGAVA